MLVSFVEKHVLLGVGVAFWQSKWELSCRFTRIDIIANDIWY
jgi:hypothetical protein